MAPPLLFVHGICHGAWCWDEHFTTWFRERGFDAMAIDLRGHGARRRSGLRWIPLNAFVEDVAAAVVALEAPPVLVAHSMGGAVVQRYLAGGGSAAAVVLLAGVPQWGAIGGTLLYARAHPLRFLAINGTMSFKPMTATPEGFSVFLSDRVSEDELERLQARAQDESYRAYVDMMLMAFRRPRPVGVPALALVGTSDCFFTISAQEKFSQYEDAELEVFDGMGHDLMLDVGWEKVAARIERFVTQLGSGES